MIPGTIVSKPLALVPPRPASPLGRIGAPPPSLFSTPLSGLASRRALDFAGADAAGMTSPALPMMPAGQGMVSSIFGRSSLTAAENSYLDKVRGKQDQDNANRNYALNLWKAMHDAGLQDDASRRQWQELENNRLLGMNRLDDNRERYAGQNELGYARLDNQAAIADAANAARTGIADANNQTRAGIANANNATRTSVADAANATRAGIAQQGDALKAWQTMQNNSTRVGIANAANENRVNTTNATNQSRYGDKLAREADAAKVQLPQPPSLGAGYLPPLLNFSSPMMNNVRSTQTMASAPRVSAPPQAATPNAVLARLPQPPATGAMPSLPPLPVYSAPVPTLDGYPLPRLTSIDQLNALRPEDVAMKSAAPEPVADMPYDYPLHRSGIADAPLTSLAAMPRRPLSFGNPTPADAARSDLQDRLFQQSLAQTAPALPKLPEVPYETSAGASPALEPDAAKAYAEVRRRYPNMSDAEVRRVLQSIWRG